jgi:hypothetical protein
MRQTLENTMRVSPARSVGVAALLALALTVVGCASLIVNSYAERGFDVQRYRTFTWGPPDTSSTGDPRLDNNRFFDERVRMQVERELATRGFEKSTLQPPDFLVHYHANVTQEIDVRNLDREQPYPEHADGQPYVYDAGTLVIDIVEARTNQLVWRGWAEGSIEGLIDSQEWLERRIDEVVARILNRLPRRI